MDWVSFISGGVCFMLAHTILSNVSETADDGPPEDEVDDDLVVNVFSNKLHQMSCQSCRKLRNHREVEPRIFECTKCHRRTNLNVGVLARK